MSRIRVIVGGTVTYVAAATLGYMYMGAGEKNACKAPGKHDHQHPGVLLTDAERHQTYAKNAAKYDEEIGKDEFAMGLNLIRWWHLRQARGKVLEVGCGTGRNFSYYGKDTTITAVDSVKDMLLEAKKKLTKEQLKRVSLQMMNAHKLDFPDQTFDTVVDTFGLCSYEEPAVVLREMSRVCKCSGKILLIEHGKGSYDWINNIIDNGAERHAHSWGCIWNRDIEHIVAQAGLQIVSTSRWHFGTTYVIEAKPISP